MHRKILIKKTSFILITLITLVSYGQNALTDFLSAAPISLFDNTTEGISSGEINNLVKKGESSNWKVSFQNKERLTISCKHPFSQVTLFFLTKTDGALILVSYTENEKTSTIETWEKSDSNILKKINVLPSIQAKDFFLKENQFKEISEYNSRVYYYLDMDTLTIEAGFDTWMIKHEYFTEDKNVDYNISLNWNGMEFEVQKTR
ncbi:hypothetical protein V6246_08840 [Algibacter sp. TI.3.09]|uniref:hypothetical protein n=1 Tax=Algibacter sp. TI.3.09 TaxID=3121298 RepID=UPI00311E7D16